MMQKKVLPHEHRVNKLVWIMIWSECKKLFVKYKKFFRVALV